MEKIKEKLKEFKISSLAVDNATSIFLVALMILLFGIQSYRDMPKEQYPNASMPTITISTPYFGNSAEEIENLISLPLEKELKSTSGLKKLTSTSIQDFSILITEFDSGIPISEVLRKVKDAVDIAKTELPTDLDTDPIVEELNFAEIPIVTVNVSGNYSADDLRKHAEYLQDRIESIKEIARVDMKGAREREVKIDVDLAKMQSIQVSFQDIENAIASENLTMSSGEIIKDGFRRAVRVVGQFVTAKEIENTIIKSENQRPIYLRDIATVEYSFKDRTTYARSDGFPVISLEVVKRTGQNLLGASDALKVTIDDAVKTLPSDLKVSLFNDQSIQTRNDVTNLENSIISGVILVILVLLFFLGLRNASFVGLAIPLSMLTGIMFLFVSGTTMNIVVLFSLILALGLLVDNAIVVVENIYRYMQNGYSGVDAAKYGTGEVAVPIIVSTMTTLAAFIPLAFWPGMMGEFMKYMPITLIIVLSSSLFVALVITPVFTSRFMKVDEKEESKQAHNSKRRNVLIGALVMFIIALFAHFIGIEWMRNLMGFALLISLINFFILRPGAFFFQNRVLPILERAYDKFIRFVLNGKKPYIIFASTFILLFLTMGLLRWRSPKVEFFPSPDPMYINVFVDLPNGSDIEKTNNIVKQVEEKVNAVIQDRMQIVEAVLTQIGENTGDPNTPPEPGVTPNKARITITFVKSQDRGGISTKTILNDIRAEVKDFAGVQVIVDQNANGPPAGKPINLEIIGDDIDTLIVVSERVKQFFEAKNIPGIEELNSDVELNKPEMMININREAARRYELSTYAIASALRTSIFGKEISKLKDGEDEHPIILRLDDNYRNEITGLMNQKITFRNPANGRIVQVPISAVADFEYTTTYNAIRRNKVNRLISLSSNVLDGYNANEIVAQMKDEIKDFNFPEDYEYRFTGEQQQQAEDMAFLSSAFILAMFMIFILIVAQFNSLISPFIILLSIVFSTIGVFLGYSITGMTISVIFSGVGIISLAGVVVNNAIVLIDYINLLIKRKREKIGGESMDALGIEDIRESIIIGGSTRLRPVLLTAITTILGLIPLALGINFNFFTLISDLDPQYFSGGDNTAMWGPMAWTIIYGLSFATFLTLVVVPVMYWIAYRTKTKLSRLLKRA